MILLSTALVLCAAAGASAQSAGDIAQEVRLDIDERRIQEAPFERSLRVDLSEGELQLLVGVGANASRVDITLRGVRGNARFRASLEEIRRRLARGRTQ